MPIYARKVKNKRLPDGTASNREGTVYDVFFTYTSNGQKEQYGKRGFLDKASAKRHEAEMRLKVSNPTFSKKASEIGKESFSDYLASWLSSYAKASVKPSTYEGYQTNINKHIIPSLGNTPLNRINGPMLDNLYQQLLKSGLSNNSVKSVQRTLSVSLKHAAVYQYISENPAKHTISKISTKTKTPDPYTISQVHTLMASLPDSSWEFMIMLGALYGLRRNEILGLQVQSINLNDGCFTIDQQLSNRATKRMTGNILASLKEESSERTLPITDLTRHYFQQQLLRHAELVAKKECPYPNFLILTPTGTPYSEEHISMRFKKIAKNLGLPQIRFHDLRHTAATNMYQLTGDFYTVGEILGHSLKGIGNQLNLSGNFEAVTERYIDVRLEHKRSVLDTYHKEIAKDVPQKEKKPIHKGMER